MSFLNVKLSVKPNEYVMLSTNSAVEHLYIYNDIVIDTKNIVSTYTPVNRFDQIYDSNSESKY